jgi:hypothetical protein
MLKVAGMFGLMLLASSFLCKKKRDSINENRDFKLITCEMTQSFGGAFGAGSSTHYKIVLKSKRNFTLNTDSGYFGGKRDELQIVLDSLHMGKEKSIKKGEEIELSLVIRDESSNPSNYAGVVVAGSPEGNMDKLLAGTLGLRYGGGKSKALVISKITKNEAIYGE